MIPKVNEAKSDFQIKLLSGNNVVMVEAKGFDAEIFMPQILNGRISFQNIIPNRRCCTLAIGSGSRIKNQRLASESTTDRTMASTNSRAWRINGGCENRTFGPAAASTPSVSVMDKENRPDRRQEVAHSPRLATPEPLRCMAQPNQVVKDRVVKIPSGVKVVHLYHDLTTNKVARMESINNSVTKKQSPSNITKRMNSKNDIHSNVNISHNNTSKIGDVPSICTPPQTNRRDGNTSPLITEYRIPSVERRKALQSRETQILLPAAPESATKWRKCLTPVRTYSRRQMRKSIPVGGSSPKSPALRLRAMLCRSNKRTKVLPSYMVNPTQAVSSDVRVEVKKRKLIIDRKTTISPRAFKRQQKESSIDLRTESKPELPRTRKEYETAKHSAFDMLTNSNRVHKMSAKLNEQFRKACINKTSSTHPKFKALCVIPPLELRGNERLEETRPKSQKSTVHQDK